MILTFTKFGDFFVSFLDEILLFLGLILFGLSLFYIFSIYRHTKESRTFSEKKKGWEEELKKVCRGDLDLKQEIISGEWEKFRKFLVKFGPAICPSEEKLKEIYKKHGFFGEDLDLIREGKWWEKAEAIKRLKILGIKEVEEEIFNLLSDEKLETRLASLDYLSKIGSSRIQNNLKNIFETNSNNLDKFLLIRLFSADVPPESLENIIESSDPRLRRASAVLLGKRGQEESISFLRELLEDDNPEVRFEVARSIGRIGSSRGLSLLSKLKDDEFSKIRAEVAKSIGKIGDAEALPLLEELVQDSVKKVRLRSFLSLAKLGEPGREIIGKHRGDFPLASKEAMMRSFTEEA